MLRMVLVRMTQNQVAVLAGVVLLSPASIAKGFIDHQGHTVFTLGTTVIAGSGFSEGLVRAERSDSGWFFLDRAGNKAFSSDERLETVRDFSGGLCAARVRRGGDLKWGFIDHSGKFVISPKFTDVYSFNEGLAPVCVGGEWKINEGELTPRFVGGKWGFIAKDGKFVVEPQFDAALQFSEGRAAVLQNGRVGFINPSGQLIIAPQYNLANSFSDGLSFVTLWDSSGGSDQSWFIDRDGNRVIDVDQLNQQFKQLDRSAPDAPRHYRSSPDYNGRQVYTGGPTYSLWAPAKSSPNDIYFQEGLLPWGTKGNIGYVDKTGKIVIPPRFLHAGHFSEGLAVVEERKTREKQGFIDNTGQMVIPARYDSADDFHEGVAVIESRSGNGEIIDRTGKTLFHVKNGASAFHEGLARVGWRIDVDFSEGRY